MNDVNKGNAVDDDVDSVDNVKEKPTGSSVALVALANPLLDMLISVEDDSLTQKFGLPVHGQLEVTAEQHPILDEVLKQASVEYVAGGSAQNTVRILQRLLLPTAHQSNCYVLGKIARDDAGAILQDLLRRDDVGARYVYDEKLPTGCCAAIVHGEMRCLAADIGAACGFQLEHLKQVDAFDLLSAAAVVYVEGFFATHSLPAALEALRFAHRQAGHQLRLVSLSAPYVCLQYHHHIRELLGYCNMVVGNEEEFVALAERLQLDAGDAATAAQAIAAFDYIPPPLRKSKTPPTNFTQREDGLQWWSPDERLAVMTRGAASVICATRHGVRHLDVTPTPAQNIRDTTGAGDAFLAGFLSQLMTDARSLHQCVLSADRVAKIVIGQTGCHLP